MKTHTTSRKSRQSRWAVAALRRLLVQLEDGTFLPPSESHQRQLKPHQPPRQTIRQLCDAFLVEKRQLRGKQTAGNYRNRLVPVIEFSERIEVASRWPLAAQVDRDFVVQFRRFLHARKVSRNGRAEDYTGLLISEVDFTERLLRFGTRLDGRDFNKGQQTFRVPFPVELVPLLRHCVAGRADGPLLQQRVIIEGRRQPTLQVDSTQQVRTAFEVAMAAARPGIIQAPQDAKALFRRLLQKMGGVSSDSLAKEFCELLVQAQGPSGARFYDLRGSIATDLKDARVDPLIQKYVTGHSLEPDIMSRYVSLRLHDDMTAYFEHIQPLLKTTGRQGRQPIRAAARLAPANLCESFHNL